MPIRILFVCILAGFALLADTAADVKVDTPQARAVVVALQQHQKMPAHEGSLNRVLVYLTPGRIKLSGPAGKAENIDFKAGDVRWIASGDSSVVENISGRPIQVVEIELRNTAPRPMPVTQLDPTVVDSGHYKVALENDQVRVMRVRYGAHEGGARHEHILNRVVVNITDQGNGKAGEVHLSGAMTHSEENKLDQPVERIAVELK
jgi:quercetin dioxygenase-like cupin family protein